MELVVLTSFLQCFAMMSGSYALMVLFDKELAFISFGISLALCIILPAYFEKTKSYPQLKYRFDSLCILTYILLYVVYAKCTFYYSWYTVVSANSGYLLVTAMFFFF